MFAQLFAKCYILFLLLILAGCGGGGSGSGIHDADKPIISGTATLSWSKSNIPQVVRKIGTILKTRAFAMGVDFSNAVARIEARSSEYLDSKDIEDFRLKINKLLKDEFAISHLYLTKKQIGKGQELDPLPIPPEDIITRAGASKPSLKWVNAKGKQHPVLVIPSFQNGEYNQSIVNSIMQQVIGSDYLIIDLRENYGGNTGNARHLLSYFIRSELL